MIKNRKHIFISALSAVLVLVLGWFFGIAPQLSRIANANSNREIVVSQNANNEKVFAQLKQDYQKIDSYRESLALLQANIPSSAELSPFIAELNVLAKSQRVTVKSLAIDEAKPYTPNTEVINNSKVTAANFVLIPVQLSLTGAFSNVLDFVQSLQTGKRLFLISNLVRTGSTSTSGTETVDSTISGYIYAFLNSK